MNTLWFRHPIRMYHLALGYCPLCNSSPPNPACPVCEGSYRYGNKQPPWLREAWLIKFIGWKKYNSK